MRFASIMLLSLAVLAAVACDNRRGVPGSPAGELFVYNNDTGALIASTAQAGTLNVEVGGVVNLRVMRRIDVAGPSFEEQNITATTADYNVVNTEIVTISSDPGFEGVLTANAVGTTDVQIRHRGANPLHQDFADMTVNVTAP